MKKTIIWLRNDLRLSDNAAINYAHENKHEIIFLYIFDEDFSIGSASKWFLHHALKAFANDIKKKYKAQLVLKSGKPQEILEKLVKKYHINSILWNRVYEPQAIKRDKKIKEFFSAKDLEVKSFNSSLLFEPSKILNLSGEYFKVFTPFWKKCLSQINNISEPHRIAKVLNIIKTDEPENLDSFKLLPTKPNWAKGWEKLYKISEEDAHSLAEEFMQNRMFFYNEGRDFPASNNTSFLSPYLHFGLISPKQIYFKSMMFAANDEAGYRTFFSEIGWREFSYHLLYHFPDLPQKNFKAKFNNFPWINDKKSLEKWQKGMTGFPLIDAGMRQLWQTGWMHNRVRMVVASFLTKNLLIDWRLGQEWFWDCLTDADLAANSASWQWVAGSGADAAPYFRIFNPVTQSEKFDPNGNYIRKWLPELAHLLASEIHFPSKRDKYPEAMVDLKTTRNRALEIYKTLR